MAYDNINFSKDNMAVVNGYFYMFDDTYSKLTQKTDGGNTAFEYPLDTIISDLSSVITTQYDGTYFWTMQKDSGTNEPYIRKWLIDNRVCKLQSEFAHLEDGSITYDSSTFCVEHYITNLTNALSIGDSIIQIDEYYNNVVSSGTIISLGPNGDGYREDVTVSGVTGTDIYLTAGVSYSYDAGDQISIAPSYFIFNDYMGTDGSTGSLMRFSTVDGSYMTSDANDDYQNVTACIFHRLQNILPDYPDAHAIIYVKGTNAKLINMSSLVEIYDASTVDDDFTGSNGSVPNSDKWDITGGTPTIYNNNLKLETTYGGIEEVTSDYLCITDFDVRVSGTYDSYTALSGTRAFFNQALGLEFPYNSDKTCEIGVYVEDGIPTYGLVAEYLMENVTGSYVYDTSGNSYHGDVYGNPTQVSGISGQALYFDGSGDAVELMTHSEASLYEDLFSISIWFRSETTTGDNQARVLSRDASDYYTLRVYQGGSFPQSVYVYYSDTQGVSLGYIAEQDTWHHVVMSWDFSNTKFRVFFDNVEKFSTNSLSNFSGSSRPIVLACNTEDTIHSGDNNFEGSIDEVRFYNKYLSDEEVDLLYNRNKIVGLPNCATYLYSKQEGSYQSFQPLTYSGIPVYKFRIQRSGTDINMYYKTTVSGVFEDAWTLYDSLVTYSSDCNIYLVNDSSNMRSTSYFDDYRFESGHIRYSTGSIPFYGTMNIDNVRSDGSTVIPVYDLGVYEGTLYRLQDEATYYGSNNDWGSLYNYQVSTFRPFIDFISLESDPDILPATGRNAAVLTAVVLDQYGEGAVNKPVSFTDDDDVGYITIPTTNTDNFFGTGEAISGYMSGLDIRIVTVQATATQYD